MGQFRTLVHTSINREVSTRYYKCLRYKLFDRRVDTYPSRCGRSIVENHDVIKFRIRAILLSVSFFNNLIKMSKQGNNSSRI